MTKKEEKVDEYAEEAGILPPIWKPQKGDEGSRAVGTVAFADPLGGASGFGYLDLNTNDGPLRVYLNQNMAGSFKRVLSRLGLETLSSLEGKKVVIEFLGWVKTSAGRQTRTFKVGVAK